MGKILLKNIMPISLKRSSITGEGINQVFDLSMNNIIQRIKNEYHPNKIKKINLEDTQVPS